MGFYTFSLSALDERVPSSNRGLISSVLHPIYIPSPCLGIVFVSFLCRVVAESPVTVTIFLAFYSFSGKKV
jgi:hypothetical protein